MKRNPDKDREKVEKTLFWKYLAVPNPTNDEINYFINTPPIGVARPSNRVLVTGTNVEIGEMKKFPDLIPEITGGFDKPEIVYLSQAAGFWDSFFHNDFFVDSEDVSVPLAIVGTGFIRSYINEAYGITHEVKNRLEEISDE